MECLNRSDLDPDPIVALNQWLDAASLAGIEDPDAMTLATADSEGRPSARTVLLRLCDSRGLVFYSHRTSLKGRNLAANPHAAVVLHWRELGRQVTATGPVVLVDDGESDAYFAARLRDSRIGAWASQQGEPLADRAALDARVAAAQAQYAGQEAVPRPPYWGGFRLIPETIEFWQAGKFRLHDRFAYVRAGDGWEISRLSP